jgi:hypothetical protein
MYSRALQPRTSSLAVVFLALQQTSHICCAAFDLCRCAGSTLTSSGRRLQLGFQPLQ